MPALLSPIAILKNLFRFKRIQSVGFPWLPEQTVPEGNGRKKTRLGSCRGYSGIITQAWLYNMDILLGKGNLDILFPEPFVDRTV